MAAERASVISIDDAFGDLDDDAVDDLDDDLIYDEDAIQADWR